MKMKKLKKKPNTNAGDINSLILRDHQPIKKLILVLKDNEATISKKRPAYTEFENLLSNHSKAEEESLYIHMKKEDDLRVKGIEGDTEHRLADQLMKEIDQIKNEDDQWMAKVKVLAELVEHHVKEEEKETLKHIQKEFDLETRIEIGKEYSKLLSQFREDRSFRSKSNESNGSRTEHA